MANKTQNYNLTQPLETEFYDINVQNENMEKIDRALKGHTDQIFHLQEGQKNKADLDESGKIPSSQLPEFTGVLPVSKGGTGNSDGYVRVGQKNETAIGDKATAEGYDTTASGQYSHAEGYCNISSGDYSHVEGYTNIASGNNSHAEGGGNILVHRNHVLHVSSYNPNNHTFSFDSTDSKFSIAFSRLVVGEIIVIRNAHYYNENLFFHIASIDSSTNSITVLEDIPDTNFSVSYAAAIVPNDCYGQHAEGAGNIAHGDFSHVEGYQNISNGNSSHAEGQGTTALHDQSHAEGCETTASGTASHAEGLRATASGHYSHAEGQNTTASGDYSHAEGFYTNANSKAGHTEGYRTTAKDFYTHAEGYQTTASNFASHAGGKNNKAMAEYGSANNKAGDVFVLGNGSETEKSNAFRVTYAGEVYGTSAFKTSGADYAEYFEWQDGNPQAEDRVGRFVTMRGRHIRIAKPDDYILGVVSGQPCIIGNADEDWLGRWEHDEFGRFVKRYMVEDKTEIAPPAGEDAPIEPLHDPQVIEENGKWYRLTPRYVDYETPSWDYKPNPDYDASQPYLERRDRKEWDAVGMLGVLPVWDDGTCQVDGWCRPAENGTATAADACIPGQTYRVIERVCENVVKIVFR